MCILHVEIKFSHCRDVICSALAWTWHRGGGGGRRKRRETRGASFDLPVGPFPDAVREERSSHLGREHPLDKMGLTISTMFARLFGKKQMRILMGETSSTELTR